MPLLSYSSSGFPFTPFTKILSADVNSCFTDIKTLLNVTGLDTTNVQLNGLSRNRLALGTASHVIINDGTGLISSEAQLATTRGGTGINPTLSTATAGQVLGVNNTGDAIALLTPSAANLIESLNNNVATITAAEVITANNAVALALNEGSYKVFNGDSSSGTKSAFLGFALNAATVTPSIVTWTNSAALVTSNVIAYTINGRAYSTTFASSNDATLAAIAAIIAADPDVQSAVVTDAGSNDRVITITGKGALTLNVTSAAVTGGASQASIAILVTQSPVGSNVRIQCFGPLSGFTSLTIGGLYYLDSAAGGITLIPTATAPYVGQAISSTTLFVSPNRFNFTFGGTEIFIRSHGASVITDATAVQDVEHYNFAGWSVGTASSGGARARSNSGGSCGYNNAFFQLDGMNTGGTATLLFQSYNKSAWSTLTNRSVEARSHGTYSFSGYLWAMKGNGGTGAGTQCTRWNSAAWGAGPTFSNTDYGVSAFSVNSLVNTVSGNVSQSEHETVNSANSLGSATAPGVAQQTFQQGSTNAPGGLGLIQRDASTNAQAWNGAAWGSALVAIYGGSNTAQFGQAAGYSASQSKAILNGGSTASAAVNTTSTSTGLAFSSSTASASSRSAACGGVV